MIKKNIKIIIFLILFNIFKCFCYYITKLSPVNYQIIGSSLDKKIPLYPLFVWFYILWYALLIIIPLILYIKDRKLFYKYLALDLICLTCDLFIYILYPSMIERPIISGGGLSNLAIKIIYFLDSPAVNCLPSEHCVICFIFMFNVTISKYISNVFKVIFNVVAIMIVLSTLFIHQHVIYDVITALLVVIFALIINKIFNIETILKNKYDKKTSA